MTHRAEEPSFPIALAAVVVVVGATLGASQISREGNLQQVAAGFHQLFLHDACIGDYPPQPGVTCLRLFLSAFGPVEVGH